jgi:hypothetical protein
MAEFSGNAAKEGETNEDKKSKIKKWEKSSLYLGKKVVRTQKKSPMISHGASQNFENFKKTD